MKNRKLGFKLLSGLISASIAFSITLPVTPVSATGQKEYYYLDFESVDFTKTGTQLQSELNSKGFAPWQGYIDQTDKYVTTEKGKSLPVTKVTGSKYNSMINGATGGYIAEYQSEADKLGFNELEQGKAFVFRESIFLKPGTVTNAHTPYITFLNNGSHIAHAGQGVHLSASGSTVTFTGLTGTANVPFSTSQWIFNSIAGGMSRHAWTKTIPEGGKWFDLVAIITYEDGVYVHKYYVDGEQGMINGTPIVARVPDAVVPSKSYKLSERTSIGAHIYLAGEEQDYIIDDIYMGYFDGLKLQDSVKVSAGATSATIKTYNGYDFTEDNPPAIATEGMIEQATVTADCFKVESYASTDKMMLNPTEVEGFTVSTDGENITLSNLPAISDSVFYKVTANGIKGIDGKAMTDGYSVIKTTNDIIPANINYKDISGNKLTLTDPAQFSMDVNRIEVTVPKGTAVSVTGDGNTWTPEPGTVGDIDFSALSLSPGQTYDLNIGGAKYAEFTTVPTGSLKCSPITIEGNQLTEYIKNSTSDEETVYLTIMGFDSNGVLADVSTEAIVMSALTAQTVSRTISLTGDTYRAVVWQDLESIVPLTPIMSASSTSPYENAGVGASISAFNDSRKAEVTGNFFKKEARRMNVALLKDGSVVYADDIKTAGDGSFKYVVTMKDTATNGTYKLIVSDGEEVFTSTVRYAKPGNSSTTTSLNAFNASDKTADTVKTILADNDKRIALELNSEVYDNDMTTAQQEEVAKVLFNNTKGKTLTKAETGEAFDEAVAIVAVKAGILNKDSVELNDLSVMDNAGVYKWYNNQDGVTTAYTDSIRQGALDIMKGVDCADTAEFEKKFVEALVYSVLDADGSPALFSESVSDLSSYIKAEINSNNYKYLGSVYTNKLKNNGVTFTALDGYSQFISKLKSYEGAIEGGDNDYSGGGSFGGGGGGGVNVSMPNENVVAPEPMANEIFADMTGYEWASPAVNALAGMGIVSGDENKNFNPANYITREEFTKLVVEMAELTPSDIYLPFEDIPEDAWFRPYVKSAYSARVINGISETEFGTGQNITRQDMAKLICNVLAIELRKPNPIELTFADTDQIADYALDSVASLVAGGILNGYEDNTFRPNGFATRAEAAQVIYKTLKFYQ